MEFASHRQPPNSWAAWMDGWVSDMRLQWLSENTREHWWYQIGDFTRHIGKTPGTVQIDDLEHWIGRGGIGNAEMRGERNAFSSFFRWVVRKS